MKKYLDGILVVEGTGDASFISSFIECEIVTTNGLDIPKSELDYLKEASKTTTIYVLTDPDEAGETIRKRINDQIDCINLNVDKNFCNKNGKHGVAECDKNELLKVLDNYLLDKHIENCQKSISLNLLEHLNINNDQIYLFIGKKFHIGKCNRKRMIDRLNRLKITENDLIKAIGEFNNGN